MLYLNNCKAPDRNYFHYTIPLNIEYRIWKDALLTWEFVGLVVGRFGSMTMTGKKVFFHQRRIKLRHENYYYYRSKWKSGDSVTCTVIVPSTVEIQELPNTKESEQEQLSNELCESSN